MADAGILHLFFSPGFCPGLTLQLNYIRRSAGLPIRYVTVYRVDFVRKTKVPIVRVVERRARERGDNLIGLLRLARKAFASSPEEALRIAVEPPRAALARKMRTGREKKEAAALAARSLRAAAPRLSIGSRPISPPTPMS